jgi:phosphatidylethanolamine/phosphatidyl-N-methylethanolamine N-methyltransferase
LQEANKPTEDPLYASNTFLDGRHVKSIYSASAHLYDSIWDSVWSYEDRKKVIETLELSTGDSLLEVGIGTGNNLRLLPSDCMITGIDFSPEMLEICKNKVQKLSLDNAALFEMDAHSMVFDDHKFDKVLSFYTLCCVEDPNRVMIEMARVCRPGGRIVIFDIIRPDIPEVAAVQYIYRPIGRELGAIYLEFCPPHNITYDSYWDLESAVRGTGLILKNREYTDPFRTAVMAVYEKWQ